jgi:protein associated with RNAse G/E
MRDRSDARVHDLEYALEKWGGIPHYRGPVRELGADEHGTWLWGPAGRTIFRGTEALFVTEHDALFVVPPGEWWAASWWLGHEELDLYVNINTPAVRAANSISTVDLDLDVIRFRDGAVEIVDRDEFAVHRVQYGYPDDVVEATERVASALADLVTRNAPPFDGVAAAAWLNAARTSPRPG